MREEGLGVDIDIDHLLKLEEKMRNLPESSYHYLVYEILSSYYSSRNMAEQKRVFTQKAIGIQMDRINYLDVQERYVKWPILRARFESSTGNNLEAIQILKSAISQLQELEKTESYTYEDMAYLYSNRAVFTLYLSRTTKNIADVKQAFTFYDKAITRLEANQERTLDAWGRYYENAESREFYFGLALVGFYLYQETCETEYLHRALQRVDARRSRLTRTTRLNHLYARERPELAAKLGRLDEVQAEREKLVAGTLDAPGIDRLIELNKEANQLLRELRMADAEYDRRRGGEIDFDPDRLRERFLPPGRTLVYFKVTEHYLMRYVLNSAGELTASFSQPNAAVLREKAAAYNELLYQSGRDESLLPRCAELGAELYDLLLRPVEHLLEEDLLIVGDDVIDQLPFTALLTDSVDLTLEPHEWPYLLRDHSVSYAYSLALLEDQLATPAASTAPRRQVLAYAPDFSGPAMAQRGETDSTNIHERFFGRLSANRDEVASLQARFPGRYQFGAEASLADFKRQAEDYGVLHLATHALADNVEGFSSQIAFAGAGDADKLYARELFSSNIPADMVVLSACATAVGTNRENEGIISLARAFTAAGARSLVATLWPVDDATSTRMMGIFYDGLDRGLPKHQALRLAQLNQLDSGGTTARPYYWAAYTAQGNMQPLEWRADWYYWPWKWLAALGAGALIAGVVYLRRRKGKRTRE